MLALIFCKDLILFSNVRTKIKASNKEIESIYELQLQYYPMSPYCLEHGHVII